QFKRNNADEAELHVRQVADGREKPNDVIPGANFADLTWTPDGRGFYYMGLPTDPHIPETDRVANAAIRFHSLGTSSSSDPVVYPKTGNSSLYLSPSLSRDGRWLFVSVINGWSSTNIYFRDMQDKTNRFQPLFISTSATAAVTEWKNNF